MASCLNSDLRSDTISGIKKWALVCLFFNTGPFVKILQMTQYYLLVSSVNYDIFVGMLVSHIKIYMSSSVTKWKLEKRMFE